MKVTYLSRLINRLTQIGIEEGDSEQTRLHKSLLVLCTIPFILTGAAWGVTYIIFGEEEAGLIPLCYAIFSLASLVYFKISHRFSVFRFSQLLLILLLPFILELSLGGFVNGSSVILWSLISPLGAMLFYDRVKAPPWLLAYIALVLVSFAVQPWLQGDNRFSRWQVNLFFTINLVSVGAIIFMMVYFFVGRKDYFQARSENLLLNILPRQVAEELKVNGNAQPKYFENVTVMFTDFKNFTKISETLSPTELVEEIDLVFRKFDHIISCYPIEKIKTIGDAYMCAGGLPVANDTHPFDLVNAALDIQAFMREHIEDRRRAGKQPFELRIGIHTGPVVAGVVGEKKFAYDIWGDTVNLASRLESSGEAGKVNISGSTYAIVKSAFQCTHRGKVPAKNKGEVDMYFVDGARTL
jgi:guanylate cyclase